MNENRYGNNTNANNFRRNNQPHSSNRGRGGPSNSIRGTGGRWRGQRNFGDALTSSMDVDPRSFGIGYAEIEEIEKAIEEKQLLPGSSDLLTRLNVPKVFNRMNELWPDPKKQKTFLCVLTAAASSRQEDLQASTHQFLGKLFNTKLIAKIMEEHVRKMRMDASKRTALFASIADSLVQLLFTGWQILPSTMSEKFQNETDTVLNTLNEERIQSDQFPLKSTKEWLDRLQKTMKAVFTAREQQNSANQQQRLERPKRGVVDSSGPPPEDFRTISVVPNQDDILTQNREVYLRKAVINGPYEDDEHYLDVQFRLLREDLCRPLRESRSRQLR